MSISKLDRVLTYIDLYINEPIEAEYLASLSGYSFHHFCYLFHSYMGVPVMTYVRHRRLELASKDVLSGKPSSWVAQEWGYTESGFYKVFRKYYGMTPKEFRKRFYDCQSKYLLRFERKSAFYVVGYSLEPPEDECSAFDIPAYWHGGDFSIVSKEDYAHLAKDGLPEVGLWYKPNSITGEFCYFFGPEVKSVDFVPRGMSSIKIPAAEYAVFTVPFSEDTVELTDNIREAWKAVFEIWLENSKYCLDDDKICFEYYCGRNVYIYVPILIKQK